MNERGQDFEWLQRFARQGAQSAFADLVRCHLDLVYATALRKLEDPGAAQEVAQNVFTALAHKAWQFAPDDSLPAWLHKTTLLESKSWLRGELRRRRREQTAAELGTTMKTTDEQPALRALIPLLDEALLSLREKDRTALLLRFYEIQSLRDVGAALGVGEDAAQKRVQGALEKLSQFFQRHGFKTATVAATTAALQQTAASASTAAANAIISATLQAAPPALAGLTAWLASFASLTKVQTVAICLAVAAAPLVWQWQQQSEARHALALAKSNFAATQAQLAVRQSELLHLTESATKLAESLANFRLAAARRAETEQKFTTWKEQVRARLLAADYQWPEDLPFIRIPKAILPQLNVERPVTPPGSFSQPARELLGLSPTERRAAEEALHNHFAAMDSLMEASRYETNSAKFTSIPRETLASQVWGVPALGDEVKQRADELQSALRADLGEERWPMVARQMESSSSDSLQRILNLDAGEKGQELAVWIQERDGNLVAGFGWGEKGMSFSSSGLALSLFLPNAEIPVGAGTVEDYLVTRPMAATLSQPALEWIRRQAETRLGTKGNP